MRKIVVDPRGLTKQFAGEIHPGILRWKTITVEPGSAPFRSLAVQLAVAAGIPVADRESWIKERVAEWIAAPDAVRASIEALLADSKDPLLVFIDQFEELFTHRPVGPESEGVTRNFVANLNDQAQTAFKTLDDAQRNIADSLFPHLITLGEGVADTRRRVRRSELYPRGVAPEAVNAVIDRLSGKDARILVTTRAGAKAEDLASGEDFDEFTHEALLSNWEHLFRLLEKERSSIRRHRSVTTATAEWAATPEDQRQKFLLRAGQLVIAEQWASEPGGSARMTDLEARFLKASTDERDAEEARKAKIARRLKMLSIGVAAAAVVAMIVGGIALGQKKKADDKTKQVEQTNANNLRNLHEASMADYAVAVQRIEKEEKWHEGVAHLARALKWEPGNPLAAGRLSSTLSLRRSEAGLAPPDISPRGGVRSAQFSPDGTRIVTANGDKTARVWDAAQLTRPPIPVPEWIPERASAVAGLRFTADGQLQAIPGEERLSILQKPAPGDDAWAVLARWLMQPAAERTVTPDSRFTCRQLAERERDTLLREGLESALRYDPTVPLVRLLLAGALLREDARKEPDERDPSLPQRTAFLREYDIQRMPDDAKLWERAVRSLHEQKDEARARRALEKLGKLATEHAATVSKELGL